MEDRHLTAIDVRRPRYSTPQNLTSTNVGMTKLQQLDRGDFQRISVHLAVDIHAKVIFLV